MNKFHVQVAENRGQTVEADRVDIGEDNILRFHDSRGVKAQFLRWEHYVCEEPASQSSSTAVGSEGQSDE